MNKEESSHVTLDVQDLDSRGFDGAETIITVITLIVSGVAGGVTGAIGEDIWESVQGIVKKRRHRKKGLRDTRDDHKNGRIVVVVALDTPKGRARLSCNVQSEHDVDLFAESVRAIEATDDLDIAGGTHLCYDAVDGWKRREEE